MIHVHSAAFSVKLLDVVLIVSPSQNVATHHRQEHVLLEHFPIHSVFQMEGHPAHQHAVVDSSSVSC